MATPKAPKEITIDGSKYVIAIHPGSEGMEIAAELAALIGPSILSLKDAQSAPLKKLGQAQIGEMLKRRDAIKAELETATGDDATALQKELGEIDQAFEPDEDELLKLLSDFLAKMKPRPLVALLKTLFSKTAAIGSGNLGDDTVFDMHFAGNYKAVIPLAREVVTYNNFLEIAAGYL